MLFIIFFKSTITPLCFWLRFFGRNYWSNNQLSEIRRLLFVVTFFETISIVHELRTFDELGIIYKLVDQSGYKTRYETF